jgi:hypothetical protein
MTGKKPTDRQRQRLADPADHAAADAAQAAGEARFAPMIASVFAEMNGLLAGRDPRQLTEAEAARFMALWARLGALATAQQRFVEADAAERLGPRGGSETAEA